MARVCTARGLRYRYVDLYVDLRTLGPGEFRFSKRAFRPRTCVESNKFRPKCCSQYKLVAVGKTPFLEFFQRSLQPLKSVTRFLVPIRNNAGLPQNARFIRVPRLVRR